MSLNVAVLGGGSFGTAIGNIAASNGNATVLWMRNQKLITEINQLHKNSQYLPDAKLSDTLIASDQLDRAISIADIVFVAIPGKFFREVVAAAKVFASARQIWISTSKGIEEESFKLMSQVLTEELPGQACGVLSGPNLAKEIAMKTITATVVASDNAQVRTTVQQALSNHYFRVYANSDIYGVELAGALKNIYAIISGMASAMQQGENTKSMIITRSLAEMSRFAVVMGANPLTFLGLAGVGDLVVTCTSPLSRNFRVGYALAQGQSLEDIVSNLHEVAEGINTTHTIHHKALELEIEMPLVAGLYKIIYNKMPVAKVIKELMLREQNSDVEFILPRRAVANIMTPGKNH